MSCSTLWAFLLDPATTRRVRGSFSRRLGEMCVCVCVFVCVCVCVNLFGRGRGISITYAGAGKKGRLMKRKKRKEKNTLRSGSVDFLHTPYHLLTIRITCIRIAQNVISCLQRSTCLQTHKPQTRSWRVAFLLVSRPQRALHQLVKRNDRIAHRRPFINVVD